METFDSEFMGQKYKIFYRRHHFVFDQNDLERVPTLVINRFNKGLLKQLLLFLKTTKSTQEILFTEHDAFDKFTSRFKLIQAAGGAVFNTEGDLLLMKRKGLWDLPKGKLTKGESIVNAAVREVEEECNVFEITVKKKIGLTYHLYFDEKWFLKETHWYHMTTTNWKDAKPQIEEDIEDISWVKPDGVNLDELDTYLNIKHVISQL
jgi:ADP-ribose pyrophosphatase YjhB (NUDIX family)